MKRQFILNLAFLIFINIIIKPFWIFGIDRTVQNTLPAADYGQYFVLFNVALLFNILLDLGLTNYNTRTVAKNQEHLKQRFFSVFLIKLALALLYFTATFLFAYFNNYSSFRLKLLLLLALNQLLVSFIQFMRSNFAGMHRYALDSVFSVADKLVMIFICGYFLWWRHDIDFTIRLFALSQTVSYAFVLATAFIVFFILEKPRYFNWKKLAVWENIKNTLPYALLVLTMTFYYRIDAIMLDKLLPNGTHEASIYAQSYRLMDAFSMLGVLFAGLLLPMFSLLLEKRQSITALTSTAFLMLVLPAFVMAVFTIFNAEAILERLYTYQSGQGAEVLRFLMWCFLLICITYIFGTLLTANGSLKILNVIAVSALILNITLNAYLIPASGAIGAAQASMITQFAVVVLQLYFVKKQLNYSLKTEYIVKITIFATIVITLISFLKSHVNLIQQLILTGILAFILVFALRLVTFHDFKVLLKNK